MARVRIGSAEIDLTLKTGGFSRSVEGVKGQVRGLKNRFTSLRAELNTTGGQLRALGAIAGAGVVARQIFELGAAVEETGSKFATVFGDSAGGVQQSIDQFSSLAGLSRQAAQEVTATTGAIVQGFGIAGDQAATMAVQVSQLAADLASFNNVPVAETARAVQAGLTGEMESLKRLGIAVLDADVKQRALAMTGKTLTSTLTAQEVVAARLELIYQRAGIQVGDLARTSDTAAASARTLAADFQNIKETIATALLPFITLVVEGFQNLIMWTEAAGAQIAVLVAEFQRSLAVLKFWDKEGIQAANLNLLRMRRAAEEVKDEIAGFANAVDGSGEGSAPAVVPAMRNFNFEVTDAVITLPRFQSEIHIATQEVSALADQTGRAADEQSRLNSLQSKFGAVARAASFIPGLGGVAGFIGTATGILGATEGLQNAFQTSTQTSASVGGGEFVLNLNLTDFSGKTTRVLRERIQDLDNRDVPVVL